MRLKFWKNIEFKEDKPIEKQSGAAPKAMTAVSQDININNSFGFLEELPNPNEFFMDGGEYGSGNDYSVIEKMDRTCPPIPATFALIEEIIGMQRIFTGDEGSPIWKFVVENFENLENFDNILLQTLPAIKQGMAINEIIWNSDWTIKNIRAWHPSRGEFDSNNKLYIVGDMGEKIPVDERFSFKVASYRVKWGNRYGFGLANYYYWPYQLYLGTAQRQALYQDSQATPKIMFSKGSEVSSLSDDTEKVVESFIKNQKVSSGLFVPDFIKAQMLSGPASTDKTFEDAKKYWAKQIALVMVGTASHLQERSTGTFAEEKVHEKIRRDLLLSYVDWLETYINYNIVKPLVDANFGPQDRKNYPMWKIVVPNVAPENFIEDILKASQAGLPIAHEYVYKTMGWEVPEENEKNLLTAPAREVQFSDTYKDYLRIHQDINNLVEK